MSTELELKLTIPRASARKAEKLPWLRNLATGSVSRSDISSVYFDTDKFKLRKHGVTLRVRKTGSKRLQTIKGAVGGVGGLERAEREDDITSAQPRLKYAKD